MPEFVTNPTRYIEAARFGVVIQITVNGKAVVVLTVRGLPALKGGANPVV